MTEQGSTSASDSGPQVAREGSTGPAGPAPSGGPFRGAADLAGGLFLLAVAVAAWHFGQPLKVGTAYRMGPGFAPMLLSYVLGGFGAVLCLLGLARHGAGLGRWPLREIALIVGSLVSFALTIERAGLLLASALVVALAGMAAPKARLASVLALAAVLAVFACLLFPIVLGLPVKVLP